MAKPIETMTGPELAASIRRQIGSKNSDIQAMLNTIMKSLSLEADATVDDCSKGMRAIDDLIIRCSISPGHKITLLLNRALEILEEQRKKKEEEKI